MRVSLVLGILVFAWVQFANGQTQTCASFNRSIPASNRFQLADTTEHSSGSHSWGVTPVFGCTYTHGNSANCDTECTVTSLGATPLDPIGGFLSVETGTLNAAGTHQVLEAGLRAKTKSLEEAPVVQAQ